MIDCLLIGFNDNRSDDFEDYVKEVKSLGIDSGAFRDLNLSFIEHRGKSYRSMDVLNHFYFEDKRSPHRKFHNADFLWPVITYLGTYLSRRGFTFDYVNLFHLEKDKLEELLKQNDVLTVAITTTLYVSPDPILDIVSLIKSHNDQVKIIIGGPYISTQPKILDQDALQFLFKYLDADFYVISNEGEYALARILQALKSGRGFDDIDNIAYKTKGGFVRTATTIESNSLEENMVDYSLFSKEDFGEFVTLRTAKSCPFSCSFCSFPERAGKYTYLNVSLVEAELDAIRRIESVNTLTFIDDTFNVPKPRFKELLRMMIRNRYQFKWNSYLRSDHIDEEVIELMKESGCEGVFLGAESGSDSLLSIMNKTSRRHNYLMAIPLLKDAGIITYTSFIMGFPGETFETFRETCDFINEAKPDYFRAQLWYCDPSTPIWRKKDEYGVKGSAYNWSHDTMDVKTACDLIDKMFLSIENSVWLPQQGFELWSVYYLQRRGMKREQVKQFIKCFNAALKAKLISPSENSIKPALIESLRKSCRFDDPSQPDMRPAEFFSGSSYLAAEEFWTNEFEGADCAAGFEALYDAVEAGDSGYQFLQFDIDPSILAFAQTETQSDAFIVTLAAYSILLSRLSGQEKTLILTVADGKIENVVPLKLIPRWDLTFKGFAQAIQEQIRRTINLQLFALHVLTDPLNKRKGNGDTSRLSFDVGYIFSQGRVIEGIPPMEEKLKDYPRINQEIGLVLEVAAFESEMSARLWYSGARFGRGTIEQISSYLVEILNEISEDVATPISEICLHRQGEREAYAVEADAREVFKFW